MPSISLENSLTCVFSHRMDCRCFWDSDTDNYARDTFMNVSLTYRTIQYIICILSE